MTTVETAAQPAPPEASAQGVVVVLGVGPGLGLSVARRFGRGGHPVAVVSRSATRHGDYLERLRADGATAVAEVADVLDRDQLTAALTRIEQRLGPIEVLYYGPAGMAPGNFPVPIEAITSDTVRESSGLLHGAVDAVAAVLPGMLERGRGTILLPTGLSAIRPMPQLGQLALIGAALHRYALTLNAALADRGVFAGSIVIGGGILGGDIYAAMAKNAEQLAGAGLNAEQLAAMALDPDAMADQVWDLATARDRAELVFSVLD
ncbi:SDR family NAD(P)-dependent oxidoreductase [Microlunatus speluncae]|uniref:SDR family NAD(P)-dependent oxidoreductase n=1 Tax=Microlunatus speluncae TaxID=2594267 RepID=UPI00126612B5|nr:SDR family NAD(P)-dependent oxidoreductase [Microlunatus speluncae]